MGKIRQDGENDDTEHYDDSKLKKHVMAKTHEQEILYVVLERANLKVVKVSTLYIYKYLSFK